MKAILNKQSEFVVLLITLLLIHTWWFPGYGKLVKIQEGTPGWFTEMFAGTFLAAFPGLTLSYWCIIAGEVLACLLATISLVTLEFWRGRSCFLRSSLVLSLFNFLMLGFGQSLNNTGTTQMFTYFALTLVLLNFVTRCSKKDHHCSSGQ